MTNLEKRKLLMLTQLLNDQQLHSLTDFAGYLASHNGKELDAKLIRLLFDSDANVLKRAGEHVVTTDLSQFDVRTQSIMREIGVCLVNYAKQRSHAK